MSGSLKFQSFKQWGLSQLVRIIITIIKQNLLSHPERHSTKTFKGDRQTCMAGGGYVAGGACMAGGVRGRGRDVHSRGVCMAGDMCGRMACMAGGHGWQGHAWHGACMAGVAHGRGHAWWGCVW